MKRIIIIFVSLVMALGLYGQEGKAFRSLSATEFEKALKDTSVVLVDVRTSEEHSAGFIAGTRFNIDVLKDSFEKTACGILPKDRVIAVYCRSGHRSKAAAGILAKNGYRVMELESGFNGWKAAGKPVSVK